MVLQYSELCETVRLVDEHGSISAAARSCGINRKTISWRMAKAKEQGITIDDARADRGFSAPDIPDDKEPVEDIIGHLVKRADRQMAQRKARRWMRYKMHVDGPVAMIPFGDIHMDNQNTDWRQLKDHLDLVAKSEATFGIHMGDILDNWVGRLCSKFADQGLTRDDAINLVEWILKESGVNWFLWLRGNHDEWNELYRLIKVHARHVCPVEQWRARVEVEFPNGKVGRMDLSHNHKGHSQWNEMHGPKKAAMLGEKADLYVSAHLHTYGLQHVEISERQHLAWLARVSGYKLGGGYEARGQFEDSHYGSSIVALFDPYASRPSNFLWCYEDLEEGLDILAYKRRRWARAQSTDV